MVLNITLMYLAPKKSHTLQFKQRLVTIKTLDTIVHPFSGTISIYSFLHKFHTKGDMYAALSHVEEATWWHLAVVWTVFVDCPLEGNMNTCHCGRGQHFMATVSNLAEDQTFISRDV